jgi:hypothetical protein
MGASKTRVDALMAAKAGGGAEGGRTPDLLIANEEGLHVARRLRVASSGESPVDASFY